jgi:EAL domain-containing protein (putative c-di-GMP-specific phosphodiesterase class I)
MITSLPIEVLKMDMRFIRNIEKDIKNFRLTELVLDIARFLGVPVVAEGVETEEQMKLLRDAQC